MTSDQNLFGALLRNWRRRRRISQLKLVAQADISQRHLSFLESGRASPSRNMVLHLAHHLGVPLRDRNLMLAAAGYASEYGENTLNHPNLNRVREMVERVIQGHEPYPAIAVDRHWTLWKANAAFEIFTDGVDPALLEPPINVLRVCLHPQGLAKRIVNFSEWRAQIHFHLEREVDACGDTRLAELLDEFRSYPATSAASVQASSRREEISGIAVPLELSFDGKVLSFISTITTFGTPTNIYLSELAIESFFPADTATARRMHRIAKHSSMGQSK